MNIRQIENKFNNIAAAINAVGDTESKACVVEIQRIISEIRLYKSNKNFDGTEMDNLDAVNRLIYVLDSI